MVERLGLSLYKRYNNKLIIPLPSYFIYRLLSFYP